jgi:hypothetical protein
LLGEVAQPKELNSYDHLDCTFYETIAPAGSGAIDSGKYEVRFNLTQPANVTVAGAFTDENGKPLGNFGPVDYNNTRGFVHGGDFSFADALPKDKVRLTVTATYTDIASKQRQVVMQTVQIAESEDKFTHKLVHPTKRSDPGKQLGPERKFGKAEAPYGNDRFDYDPGYILVALVREPADTSEIDYLCGYGRSNDSSNHPYLGLPGQGSLTCKDGGSFVECASACCYLYDMENIGGVHIEGAAFNTDAGTDNGIIAVQPFGTEVNYTMPSNQTDLNDRWANMGAPVVYDRDAGWLQTAFHYEMKLALKYNIGSKESPHYKTYEVIITSKKDALFSKSAGADHLTVISDGLLPIKIAYGCFAAGTRVLCAPHTWRPIEEIRIGDRVVTADGRGYARVRNTWTGRDAMLVEIAFAEGALKMTEGHPVLTPGGYVKAGALKLGDAFCGDDKICTVTSVTRQVGDFAVYNLDTDGDRPFIAEGVAVGTNRTQNERVA